MGTILLLLIIFLVIGGGGGYYGYHQWGPYGGIGPVVLAVIVIALLFGRL